MIFEPLPLAGAWRVRMERKEDERGFFARTFCREEFDQQGLATDFIQCNLSFNHQSGTLRGLHYQAAPHEEVKLVRCQAGTIYDVVVDLRPDSETYLNWIGLELPHDDYSLLYVPEGFAHGYQTLTDNCEVYYQVSTAYRPEAERGIRWDDPALDIRWPLEVRVISEKDRSWPLREVLEGKPVLEGSPS